MKRKPRFGTILFILLLLAGLGVLLYPTACDYYYRWQAKREVENYNQVLDAEVEDYSSLWAAAEDYNRRLLDKENQLTVTEAEEEEIAGLLNPLGTGMMGYVTIPKIGIEIPIYQGTEESALQAGAGFWLGSSLPTGGESTHCVLTAHNGLVKAKMFTDIDQLEVGDIFYLSVLNRTLTYQVDKIQITTPDNVSPLYITKGRDYVTLYTCTPYGVNTHRLLVRGHRIYPTDSSGVPASGLSIVWIFIAAAIVLLLLILLLWLRRRKKKRKQAKSLS